MAVACIGVGVRSRYLAGHMADDGYAVTFLTSAEPGAAWDRAILAEAARDVDQGLAERDLSVVARVIGQRGGPA